MAAKGGIGRSIAKVLVAQVILGRDCHRAPQDRFDLRFDDFRIAALAGTDLIRSSSLDGPDVPIVLATESLDPTIELAASRAGAVGYISIDDLSAKIVPRRRS